MEFVVKVENGEVFINGEFVSQLCWDNESVGLAIASWLDESEDDEEDEDDDVDETGFNPYTGCCDDDC